MDFLAFEREERLFWYVFGAPPERLKHQYVVTLSHHSPQALPGILQMIMKDDMNAMAEGHQAQLIRE
jgi:hypothetical protein